MKKVSDIVSRRREIYLREFPRRGAELKIAASRIKVSFGTAIRRCIQKLGSKERGEKSLLRLLLIIYLRERG